MDEIISKADKNLMSVIEQCCTGITWEQAGKVKKASKCPFFSADDTRFYVWPEKDAGSPTEALTNVAGRFNSSCAFTIVRKARHTPSLKRCLLRLPAPTAPKRKRWSLSMSMYLKRKKIFRLRTFSFGKPETFIPERRRYMGRERYHHVGSAETGIPYQKPEKLYVSGARRF